MFFRLILNYNLRIHPKDLGPHLQETIKEKFEQEVEGTTHPKWGYIVSVIQMSVVGKARIEDNTGYAVFPIQYEAVVFHIFKNEIVNGIVELISEAGFTVNVGPLSVLVYSKNIPEDMTYDPNSTPPCFKSPDESRKIQIGSHVRIKVFVVDENKMVGMATISQDYLGV
ncbi:DNA-directed RNA polymerase ii subunit rpb7 [Anaeramoeba ignava]|uniref:DNA-directed RNA polymerase ii subunit rpb7 n=1 Tax=Anaeramoeba ignava TaxID=1746090 RepID=A0A9Q0RFT8_ANAIG|nr:DNA-directed RNA polymerase ii subunit rpb7 [Anaeramoeba ignava]